MKYIVGIDESGTGAWAGPFTVCAFAMPDTPECAAALKELGVGDSKKLSDKKRRAIYEELPLVDGCFAKVSEAGPRFKDHQEAWREAIAQCAKDVLTFTGVHDVKVIVDGVGDSVLRDYFSRVWSANTLFTPGADARYLAVGAASIIAKTVRNDLMIELAAAHPQYGFDAHMGYGTPDHLDAVKEHGICAAHRKIRPLAEFFEKGKKHG